MTLRKRKMTKRRKMMKRKRLKMRRRTKKRKSCCLNCLSFENGTYVCPFPEAAHHGCSLSALGLVAVSVQSQPQDPLLPDPGDWTQMSWTQNQKLKRTRMRRKTRTMMNW